MPDKVTYIYRTMEEAYRKTGKFSLESFKMSAELGNRIDNWLQMEKIVTHIGQNQKNTSTNIYTLNFCLKHYYGIDSSNGYNRIYCYLDGRGAFGSKYQYYDKSLSSTVPAPGKIDFSKTFGSTDVSKSVEALQARTPSLEQMYFWVCQKYPNEIMWVNCSH